METTPQDIPAPRDALGPFQRLGEAIRSLQFKGTALVAVLTLSVTGIVAGYLVRSGRELVQTEHQLHLVQVAKMLAKAAGTTMQTGELNALQRLADESANGEPLLYVMFSDDQGRPLVSSENRKTAAFRGIKVESVAKAPVPGKPVPRNGSDEVPVFLDVTYPVTIRLDGPDVDAAQPNQKLLGYVRTGMSADGWQTTMSSRLDWLVGVGILGGLAAIPMGFLLIRRIVSPLEGLAQAMLRFSQGQLDVRSPVLRRDEIGRLAEAFNRMADQHQHTHERIVRLNAELEKRVVQRTQQLRELASREPLTGLFNRRHFNEMLERRFAEAQRYETDLSCLMIDLDGFKIVNDEFGHHVGDEVLQITANMITAQLRSSDVPARYGGDEFIALLPQTDVDRARVLVERIMERFQKELSAKLPHLRVTMSVGIASLPSPDIHDADGLVRLSDHALYEAKSSGKNRVVTALGATRTSAI